MKTSVLALALATLLIGHHASMAQTKPATSGKPSFNEAEPDPHGAGDYHPNQPHESMAPVDGDRARSDRGRTR